jgi:hypothetical protein
VKLKILLFMLIGVFLVSSAAMGDTIQTTGTWSDLNPASINGNGSPFWDHFSWDANLPPGYNPPNIGNEILYHNLIPSASAQYLSNSGAASNVSFLSSGAPGQVTLLLEIAANKGQNALYAYEIGDPSQTIQIFAGSVSSGTVPITIPATWTAGYGFMLDGPGGIFYSGGSVDGSEAGHFAFFQDSTVPNTWWFGIEDLKFLNCNVSDKDYQDMIVELQTTSGGGYFVPLPPSAVLLGSGLLGLVALRWKRRDGKS